MHPTGERDSHTYGPIGMIWFDTPMSMTVEQSQELYDIVKSIQPDCLVSGRIGHGIGDYITTSDNRLPAFAIPQAWELPATLNSSWGYKHFDHNWRTPKNVFRELVKVVSRGGNYLLNIGPRGDGSVPEASVKILDEVGKKLEPIQEAFYGTRVTPNYVYEQDQFVLTRKPHKLYIYLLGSTNDNRDRGGEEEPLNVVLDLHNIGNEVKSVKCLSHDVEVEFKMATISKDTATGPCVGNLWKDPWSLNSILLKKTSLWNQFKRQNLGFSFVLRDFAL